MEASFIGNNGHDIVHKTHCERQESTASRLTNKSGYGDMCYGKFSLIWIWLDLKKLSLVKSSIK